MPRSDPDLQPLSARSVALSLLLGAHPRPMGPGELIQRAESVGIGPATLRVALTRAVAAGDLRRVEGDYALGDRLIQRQQRQEEGVQDAARQWDGSWEMAVVVVSGRAGPERATLRRRLADQRMAELREGVWMRPANLSRSTDRANDVVLQRFSTRPKSDPAALAARLWDLEAWAAEGEALLGLLERTHNPALRLAAAARIVRHLGLDPLLPTELLPAEWPGERLRSAYAAYEVELTAYTER